jgi:hypothetical protein
VNKFLKVTNLLSGLLLIRFSLSKLFAWPISVKAFVKMAKPIGIDPTFFNLLGAAVINFFTLKKMDSFNSLSLFKK